MDAGPCPKCGSSQIVAGRIMTDGPQPYFEPAGLRFFGFRMLGRAVPCQETFSSCGSCGLVWSHLLPGDLLRFVSKHCKDEIQLKLSACRKSPTESDLA